MAAKNGWNYVNVTILLMIKQQSVIRLLAGQMQCTIHGENKTNTKVVETKTLKFM